MIFRLERRNCCQINFMINIDHFGRLNNGKKKKKERKSDDFNSRITM